MSIVNEDCFIGHFRISLNKHELVNLNDYINRYEKKILIDLLGVDMYNLLKADLSSTNPQVPTSAPWTDIFDCFTVCTPCGKIYNSDGLKDMITGFIYYHWVSEQGIKQTSSGVVRVDSENSSVLKSTKHGLANYYNDAVANYIAIQYYICNDLSVFETSTVKFQGINKEFTPLI